WAVDAGIIKRGSPVHRFFKLVERFQYRFADVIGVQTLSNAPLVAVDSPSTSRIEVLPNWLSPPSGECSAMVPALGPLEGRTIFVYAGNMGVAQGMDTLIELARRMRDR